MKTKLLAGAVSAILFTASVVVGFFHHGAFVTQTSNHRVGRNSLSQTELSATTSGADELSSLLQLTKSEFGMSATNSASTTGDVLSSANTATVINNPSNDILKATQSTLQHSGPVLTAEEGKALPLSSYIRASANGNAPSGPIISSWSTTKEKIELIKSNTIRLTGRDPSDFPEIEFPDFTIPKFSTFDLPEIKIPDFTIPEFSASDFPEIKFPDFTVPKFSPSDFPEIKFPDFSIPEFSAHDMPNIERLDFSSIQQFLVNLPPDAKMWVAMAAGTTLIIIGASNSKDTAVASSEDIQSTSDAIDGLTDELGTLQSRMKALEATGLDLDDQLKDAKSKLTQKELDISKAKLQAADASLSLSREIDLLKQKLQDNDGKVKTLDEELNKAREECESLVKELEKSKKEQAKEVPTQVSTKTMKTTPRKVSTKRSVSKKIASISEVKEKASRSGVWTSDQELPQAALVMKVTRKKAATKTGDLTTLSNSALNRTTVEVLVEYLESKGIPTTDENGKTLKKELLLEAVRSQ